MAAGTDNNLSCFMYPRRLGFVDVYASDITADPAWSAHMPEQAYAEFRG